MSIYISIVSIDCDAEIMLPMTYNARLIAANRLGVENQYTRTADIFDLY